MPKKVDLNDIEAIDVLRNEIADYVTHDYCEMKKCPYTRKCLIEGAECKFVKSIERVVSLINRQNHKINSLYKELGEK